MEHWVIAYRRVRGAPATVRRRLRADVTGLLAAALVAEDATPDADGSLLLRLPATIVGRDLHKQVRLRTGVALEHGARTNVPLQWEAEPGRHAFPVFRGTIEVEPLSSQITQLAVVGAVTPPLGPIGALADATVLGGVAERTTQQLADRLAAALEERAAPSTDAPSAVTPAPQLRVSDVMTPDPLVLHEDMPLKTAALLLFHFDVAGAPVRGEDGGLAGVLSESDLLAVPAPPALGADREAERNRAQRRARTVGEACTRPAKVVHPDATLTDAAGMLRDADVGRLVVVAGAEVVGVLSRHDVLRAVIRDDAETQAALEHALRDFADSDIVAQVEWGVVTLRGSVERHSTANGVVRSVRAVDGVVAVDSGLEWVDDDLLPPVVP